MRSERAIFGDREHLGIGDRLGKNGFPSDGLLLFRAAMREDGVHQFADGVDLAAHTVGNARAHGLLDFHQQFHALHGVEAEIEFEIVSGTNFAFRLRRVVCE